MKKTVFIVTFILFSFGLFSEIVNFYINCSEPQIVQSGDYETVNFEHSVQFGETGMPSLPYFGVQLLLPQNEKARSLKVIGSNRTRISGEHLLYPVQPQQPLSDLTRQDFIAAEASIYNSFEIFPSSAYNGFRTDFYSGYSILSAAVTPLEYVPVNGELYYYKDLEIIIETEPVADAYRLDRFLNNKTSIVNYLNRIVNNPEMIFNYQVRNFREEEIDYLIIAEESKVDLWEQLAYIHKSFGKATEIVTIEYILSSYDGIDDPERIRNFLIEQYEEFAVQYVLLAGDTDVIPHRGLYGIVNASSPSPTTDLDIPADMYYSCLDRGSNPNLGPDWNNDNDEFWGEPDEADLIPEFAIGRFPYNNDQEIENFINKVEKYLNNPVIDQLTTALFLGEDLGWSAWGGDHMDEMIGGSDNYGYSTTGVPVDWNISTLYDRDGYWNQYDLYNQLNNGPNLISHLGHSSTQYTMKIYNNNVTTDNITNNGIENNFSIIFTQGCYGGAFDNRNSNGSYVGDCITERFVGIETSAVSMISHSRYGWGSSYDTNGASQHYNREYMDAIFGEEIYDLGYALNDAKIDAIPFMSNVMYWVAYETNLMGDPALSIWTDYPEEIVVTHPSDIVIGSQQLQINSAVTNATVAVLSGTELIGVGDTGTTGQVTVEFNQLLENLGEITLKVSKHNFLNYESEINIIPSDGPYIICNNVEYIENGEFNDGVIQSLDILDLNVTLNNIGFEASSEEIYVNLSTESTQVEIIEDNFMITDLASLEEDTIENAFKIELLSGIPNSTIIEFSVNITSGENNWQSNIFLTVSAPELQFGYYTIIPDSGDDLSLDPGESAELYLTLINSGAGYSYELNTSIFSYDQYVTASGFSLEEVIAPGEELTVSEPFIVQVAENCPQDYFADLEILVYDIVASGLFFQFSIPIGLTGYNFENAIEWEHMSLTAGFSDEWHLETYRNHTDNGSFSMKCGGAGSSDYSASLHAAMTSPVIPISGNTIIRFWHWMDAEIQNTTSAWDGGLIEASFNGGEFSPIQPVGGYPYTIVNNQDSPFDPGMPVFSGTHDWEQVELDLSGYTGSVQLRFVFGSDGFVNGEGWYIDDVTIENLVDAEEDVTIPVISQLKQNHPNPFNPVTNIGFTIAENDVDTEISIYNLKGQRVTTLIQENLPRGDYSVTWEGKDEAGRDVSSGVYFSRMRSGRFTSVKKMILMK